MSQAVFAVTVDPGLPVLAVTSNTNQTCLGQTVILTASGAHTYTWSHGVTNGVPYTPSGTTTYTVSGGNGCGTSTAITSVSVSPLPVSVVSNPTVICAGSPSTLQATTAANSYTWLPVNLYQGTIIVSPGSTTVYTVTASDGICSGVAELTLNVLPIPTINVVASASAICAGQTVTMTASGGINYTWSPGNLSGNTVTFSPSGPSLYTVVGNNSVGCTSGTTQIVVTDPSPVVNVTGSPTLICPGDVVQLIASGNAAGYNWTNGPSGTIYTVSPLVTTNYTVTGASGTNNCTTSKSILITVFNPVITVVSSSSAVCSGKTVTLTAIGGDAYFWDNGSVNAVNHVTPTSTTNYTVSVSTTTDALTCSETKFIQVITYPNPTVMASSSRTTICKNESTVLNASGANTYTWSSGSTQQTATVSPTLITIHIYTVTGTDLNGCEGIATMQVRVIPCASIEENPMDRFFTVYPNPSDGNLTIDCNSGVKLVLIDSQGRIVRTVETSGAERTIRINGLSSGVYFLKAEGIEGVVKRILID